MSVARTTKVSKGSVPAVRHYYKLPLAPLPASVGAAAY